MEGDWLQVVNIYLSMFSASGTRVQQFHLLLCKFKFMQIFCMYIYTHDIRRPQTIVTEMPIKHANKYLRGAVSFSWRHGMYHGVVCEKKRSEVAEKKHVGKDSSKHENMG